MDDQILEQLEERLGRLHARERLRIENAHQQKIFGGGINFFHPENWYSFHAFIRYSLMLLGVYGRGRRNARNIRVQNNTLSIPGLPEAFDGFTVLHISDLHLDMAADAVDTLIRSVQDLQYDLCVLTGDYRARTSGPFEATLQGMQQIRSRLKDPVYGVLGNHDSIRMVPGLEAMGIRMLLNESATIEREGAVVHLSGIDDAHYYRVDNIAKAARAVPRDGISVLLSHTPEIYRQAANAQFNVLLCGHTHGGQICLPGGYPLTLDARCPRNIGAGTWSYGNMIGYTSVGSGTSIVDARLNCPPEVTLHRLTHA